MNFTPWSEPARGVRIELRGASLEAPKEWEEESVLFLHAPGPRPQPNLTLTRVSLKPGETLDTYAAKKVAELAGFLAGVHIQDQRETVAAGQRAIAIRARWEALEGPMVQRLVLVGQGDGAFVLTGTALSSRASLLDPAFDAAVASLRLTAPAQGR
jgi:hypothetical protein